MSDNSIKLLSDITIFAKYSRYIKKLFRRETWEELCYRNRDMHLKKYPSLYQEILDVYKDFVIPKKVLPSMRALQFSGKPIEINPARIYNCGYLPMSHHTAFSELMFLILGGTGIGYSVQKHHIEQLPEIKKPRKTRRFLVEDSLTGWAESVKVLCSAYFFGKSLPIFDYSNIRPKGSELVTSGGKAPGSEPLKTCLFNLQRIFDRKQDGEKLTSLEVHDMACFIADAVLTAGTRRAALICGFDVDDEEMLTCKYGNWWEENPQRARANNSAIIMRHKVTKEKFNELWEKIKASGSGEPGIYFSNNQEWFTNPCVTGDTEILTKDGYAKIEDLVDTEVEIWNGFEWSKVTPMITGADKDIVTVTFSDGRILTCTEYHKFHIATDYKDGTDIVEAVNLQPGMKLIKHKMPILTEGPELEDAYTQGFVSADGMELNRTLQVYKPKEMCLERIQNKKIVKWEEKNKRYNVTLSKVPVSKNMVPINYNIKSKIEWLAGLFDGDGTELKEGGLQLVSVNREFLDNLQKLLSTLGVQSKISLGNKSGYRKLPDHRGGSKDYFCQTSYRICIGAVQMQHLKSLGLKCERMSFEKTPQRDASQFVTVVDVTSSGKADLVYCFTEPKRNLAMFNGVLTGQCCEIALRPYQFCNLTEINGSDVTTQEELEARAKAASFLGTIQAGYTDFHYLRDIWKRTTEKDALIGVGITGIASGTLFPLNLTEAAEVVKKENERVSSIIGINSAARTTCVKPSGTTSLVVGSSSGIHAWHSEYYIRNIRFGKSETIYKFLKDKCPDIVHDDILRPKDQAVIGLPVKAPEKAIFRHESAIQLLERIKKFSTEWVKPGHKKGDNTHNVSATVSVGEKEWSDVGEWMWNNRESYNGLAVLPRYEHTYVQAPFEECTKEKYEELFSKIKDIDFSEVKEDTDDTNLTDQAACAGGACEI